MRYLAIISRDGDATLAEFPDCPGCQTFAEGDEDIKMLAQEALEGWLETHLADGQTPPRPSAKARKGATMLPIPVSPTLSVRLALRWARIDAGLTQAQLAQRMQISQQAYAQLESPDANLSMRTLEKAARALGGAFDVEYVPAERALATR